MGFDRNFAIVPAELLEHHWLSANARLLYVALARHRDHRTGFCYPSIETLSGETKLAARTIKAATRELVDFGLVVVKRKSYQRKVRNLYWLPDPSDWAARPEAQGYMEKACLRKIVMSKVKAGESQPHAKALEELDQLDAHVNSVDQASGTDQLDAHVNPRVDAHVNPVPDQVDAHVTDQLDARDRVTDQSNKPEKEEHTSLDISAAIASASSEPIESSTPEPEPRDDREVVADMLAGMLGNLGRGSSEQESDEETEWLEVEQEANVESNW